MLELGNPGVFEIVRVIHHRNRLEPFLVARLVPEFERPIRELPETKVEILVDRSGEN